MKPLKTQVFSKLLAISLFPLRSTSRSDKLVDLSTPSSLIIFFGKGFFVKKNLMSGDLTRNVRKPWLNVRVEDCCVDGTLKFSGLDGDIDGSLIINDTVSFEKLQSTGSAGFFHDTGADVLVKNIGITDLQDIGVGAPDGTVLTHNAGTVSFVAPGADESIYSTDGVLTGDRTVDCDNNSLTIDNFSNVDIGDVSGSTLGECVISVNNNNFLGTGNAGGGYACFPAADETVFSAILDDGSGIRSTLGYDNTASGLSNGVFSNSSGNTLSCSDGVNTSSIVMDATTLTAAGTGKIDINSNNVNLLVAPSVDAAEDNILTRDPLSGRIKVRDASTITNIYNSDGVLTGNRTVDCNSNDLHIDSNENFRINEYGVDDCTMTIDQTDLLGTGNPGARTSIVAGTVDIGHEVVGGEASVYYRNSAISAENKCNIRAIGSVLSAESATEFSSLGADVIYAGAGGIGSVVLNSNNVRISNEPFENSSATRFLCRNNATDEMEVKDESDIVVAPDQITIGGTGQVLTNIGGVTGWSLLRRAMFRRPAVQIIPATSGGIGFTATQFNNSGIVNNIVGSGSQFTVPGGIWYCNAIATVFNNQVGVGVIDEVSLEIRTTAMSVISENTSTIEAQNRVCMSTQGVFTGPATIEIVMDNIDSEVFVAPGTPSSSANVWFMAI